MAASVETSIMAALFKRVSAFPTPLPIAWPNKKFDRPGDGKYLRVSFIPNTALRLLISSTGKHRHIGILQVSVLWPQNDGEEAAREIAAAVAAWFPCDLPMTSGEVNARVTKRPDAGPLMVEDSGVMIPVTISYEAFA